jgi:hypothetical protein
MRGSQGTISFHSPLILSSEVFFKFYFYFLVVLGFELRALFLVGKNLSRISWPFFRFSYFLDRGLYLLLRTGLRLQFAYLYLYRHVPLYLAFLLKWGLANFLSGLVLNCNSPDLCHLNSWDYKWEPVCPLLLLTLKAWILTFWTLLINVITFSIVVRFFLVGLETMSSPQWQLMLQWKQVIGEILIST